MLKEIQRTFTGNLQESKGSLSEYEGNQWKIKENLKEFTTKFIENQLESKGIRERSIGI